MSASRSTTSAGGPVVPVEQYVAGLSRKRMAAGVLFRDVRGRVLTPPGPSTVINVPVSRVDPAVQLDLL